MQTNGWKTKNRKEQEKYWMHLRIKEEVGNKMYKSLISEGKLNELEQKLANGETIHQLLSSL
jgi:putative protein kinase ArgK-like GTPase of G3E family